MRYIDTRELIDEVTALHTLEKTGVELTEEDLSRIQSIEDLLSEVGLEAPYGVTLIPEDDFVDYAEQLAEDLGMVKDQSWPYCHIDWDAAADSLRMDYSSVEFDGVSYLFRA
jgi:antirestriction protein